MSSYAYPTSARQVASRASVTQANNQLDSKVISSKAHQMGMDPAQYRLIFGDSKPQARWSDSLRR